MDKIAIIGMGLIGGSIGLALKNSKATNLEVIGHDAVSYTHLTLPTILLV